jgi:hypothetical protein
MEIKLNNNDIHAAIRGFLQERNIVESHTDINIAITVSRGVNSGATAEITILEPGEQVANITTIEDVPIKPGALFSNSED